MCVGGVCLYLWNTEPCDYLTSSLEERQFGAVGSIGRGRWHPPGHTHPSAWASGAAAAHGTLYQLPGG